MARTGEVGLVAMTRPPRDTAQFVGSLLTPVHRRVTADRRRLSGA